MADLTGRTLGNYRVLERIGRGGMAVVYKAYQPALERSVAIKVIHEHLVADDDTFLKRFQREAKSVAALRHPNIVQVFDFGTEDDVAYMVMEYLDGITLKARLKELAEAEESMPLAEVQRVFRCVASAVDYAHERGMIHRDLKPANVMLTTGGRPGSTGEVVLTDFGIAKIVSGTQYTATGAFTGTPDYMSPEQCKGERGDERSDVYALGVMLYEMLTGQVPFGADTPWAVIMKHINDPLPLPRQVNPSIPEAAQLVVLKALEKRPEDRYQRATDMLSAVTAALRGAEERETSAGAAIQSETIEGGMLRKETVREEVLQKVALQDKAPQEAVPVRQGKPRKIYWLGAAGLGLLVLVVAVALVGSLRVDIAHLPRLWPEATAVSDPSDAALETPMARNLTLATPAPRSGGGLSLYDAQGAESLMVAETWETPGGKDLSKAALVGDPKGIYGQVARLSVRGYGHGEHKASVSVFSLGVPDGADIVSIPIATGANGPVETTDSESGLEIRVREPESEQSVWTYASHMMETRLDVPYIRAFADVSAFQGQRVELTIFLRQVDVCAGAACTHDADVYIGDLVFEALPDVCTTQADGHFELYDYYDDPTPHRVNDCQEPQPYYYMDVREGPYNAYGVGEDVYTTRFVLREGAELLEFRLYYGFYATQLSINDHTFGADQVHAAFPLRLGTYVNIPEPSRYLPVNNNPEAIAPYLRQGLNIVRMTVSAEKSWEERPFDLYARFRVPNP